MGYYDRDDRRDSRRDDSGRDRDRYDDRYRDESRGSGFGLIHLFGFALLGLLVFSMFGGAAGSAQSQASVQPAIQPVIQEAQRVAPAVQAGVQAAKQQYQANQPAAGQARPAAPVVPTPIPPTYKVVAESSIPPGYAQEQYATVTASADTTVAAVAQKLGMTAQEFKDFNTRTGGVPNMNDKIKQGQGFRVPKDKKDLIK